jgi:hypothetical protein
MERQTEDLSLLVTKLTNWFRAAHENQSVTVCFGCGKEIPDNPLTRPDPYGPHFHPACWQKVTPEDRALLDKAMNRLHERKHGE